MKRSVAALLVLNASVVSGICRPAYGQGTKPQPSVERVDVVRSPDNYAELKDFLTIRIANFQEWRRANESVPLFLFLEGVQVDSPGLAVGSEPPKPEPSKPEPSKPEPSKPEPSKPEAAVSEAAKLESAKLEAAKLEAAKLEAAKSQTAKSQAASITDGWVRVRLEVIEKDDAARRSWVQVLKTAREKGTDGITVSVGPRGAPFYSNAGRLELRVDPWYRYWVWAFLGFVAIVIVILARNSNMLRDSNGATPPPHSLAKYQMAIWFLVVVGSYLFVWMITGTFSTISPTALTLIGISGATGLVAVAMDNSKRDDARKARIVLQSEHDALDSGVNAPGGLRAQLAAAAPGSPESQQIVATITTKQTRLNELKQLLSVPQAGASPTRRWYLDLLSDQSGVSFHRLQMAVWTVVLAIVFIRAVRVDVLMPTFDATLLGLLGISSGTYLGFKFPEASK